MDPRTPVTLFDVDRHEHAHFVWTGSLSEFLAENEDLDGEKITRQLAMKKRVLIGGGAATAHVLRIAAEVV